MDGPFPASSLIQGSVLPLEPIVERILSAPPRLRVRKYSRGAAETRRGWGDGDATSDGDHDLVMGSIPHEGDHQDLGGVGVRS